MKKIVGIYVIISYSNFSEKFMIQIYAIITQLGGATFYSRKLTLAKISYKTT